MASSLKSWLDDPQFVFDFAANDIVVDLFAGGGGASVGIEAALGRPVDVAINHNPVALAIHEVNHPTTLHLSSDVWEVDPRLVARGRNVKLAWFSPDCTHFSRAKGATPVEKNIRSLAWVVVDWIDKVAPEVIAVENVPELLDWGPLVQARDSKGEPRWKPDGGAFMIPDRARKGETFREWVEAIRAHGYSLDYRTLKGSDYGAPTSRERLFVVARRDGAAIKWPQPTHGTQGNPPMTATDIIDWGIITPSVFLAKEEGKALGVTIRRPLANSTLLRIAKGVRQFVINTDAPYFISAACSTGATHPGLACAHIIKHFTGITGQDIRKPLATITAIDHHGLVVSRVAELEAPTEEERYMAWWAARFIEEYSPAPDTDTIASLIPEERASYLRVDGQYMLVDIGMRMLEPKELFKGQGFPNDYVFDRDQHGKRFTKTAQIAACGNSVPPVLTQVVVQSQLCESAQNKEVQMGIAAAGK